MDEDDNYADGNGPPIWNPPAGAFVVALLLLLASPCILLVGLLAFGLLQPP
jgi:hypothetical protein